MHVGQRAGAVQDPEVRRYAVGDLLAGVAVDAEVAGQGPVDAVEGEGDQADRTDHEHERVRRRHRVAPAAPPWSHAARGR